MLYVGYTQTHQNHEKNKEEGNPTATFPHIGKSKCCDDIRLEYTITGMPEGVVRYNMPVYILSSDTELQNRRTGTGTAA